MVTEMLCGESITVIPIKLYCSAIKELLLADINQFQVLNVAKINYNFSLSVQTLTRSASGASDVKEISAQPLGAVKEDVRDEVERYLVTSRKINFT